MCCARGAPETAEAGVSFSWCDPGIAAGTVNVQLPMAKAIIRYARCSSDKQDLAAQRATLIDLGGAPQPDLRRSRIYRDEPRAGQGSIKLSPPCDAVTFPSDGMRLRMAAFARGIHEEEPHPLWGDCAEAAWMFPKKICGPVAARSLQRVKRPK